ncbi:hypothetical protein [Gordonia desulfuricans]|uniref:hypothetical protein n=2 Tax=Gordonia desulfuricans TaxID=89051 RepID=UPI000AE0DD66|nr:hypothetical protein [Gordonia desulfuricans]
MQHMIKRLILLSTAVGATAVAGLAVGGGVASAAVPDGTYNLCVETRYGSSVEQKCSPYEVKGDQLIGTAGTPLTLVQTATGGYADIPPVSRLTLIRTSTGFKAINSVLGVPVATSSFNPVEN